MAAADLLLVFALLASLLAAALGCPEVCSCADKYGRRFAECSYKDLTEVPEGFPVNVTTVSLSANRIGAIPVGSFDDVPQVTSLWLAHNEIVSVQRGSLLPLVHLRNFDISHNQIRDFPWEDLQNLTALQMLKMNHNHLSHLPRDAFFGLVDLRSVRLNNNRLATVAEGTFDGLASLSHLQIYNNPFACSCTLDWLRGWIATTTISVSEQNAIQCQTPEELRGEVISELPESKCATPNVTIQTEPGLPPSSRLYEDARLILTCEFTGNPTPSVVWKIRSRGRRRELVLPLTGDSVSDQESDEDSSSVEVFVNGTLLISNLRKDDSGRYSCSAANQFGDAEDSVSLEVLEKLAPARQTTTTVPPPSPSPTRLQRTEGTSVSDAARLPETTAEGSLTFTSPSSAETRSDSDRDSKCGLTADTKNISGPVFNRSLDDAKHFTFDFGVIALSVSETEATVRLNPLLLPGLENAGGPDLEPSHPSGLYLCVAADGNHAALQWSRIEEGVTTYRFGGLRPGTNYSLCLTYRGQDCEVQVLFATRRRVPNLLIIIAVSACLLSVSTVPLLGATCFHLVYRYRSRTYELVLKAGDRRHVEGSLEESQEKVEPDEDDAEAESRDDGENDTEESVVTESLTLSRCRDDPEDCEAGSECSDRLPLGAEAVNITNNYRDPEQ